MTQEKLSVERPSGGDTPLRRFIGTLDSWKQDPRIAQADNRQYVVAQFNFKDLEVLESVEVYPYPIAVIEIGYAPPKTSRGGTKWEAFAGSLRKLMPQNTDIDALVGKKQEWHMVTRQLRRGLTNDDGSPMMDGNNRQIWGDADVLCWTIASVEGLGSVAQKDEDFNVYLVDLADGKTEPQFYEAAFTNEAVRNRPNIVKAITDRVLLATLTEMGLLDRDAEGILHKVTGTPAGGTAGGDPAAQAETPA